MTRTGAAFCALTDDHRYTGTVASNVKAIVLAESRSFVGLDTDLEGILFQTVDTFIIRQQFVGWDLVPSSVVSQDEIANRCNSRRVDASHQ